MGQLLGDDQASALVYRYRLNPITTTSAQSQGKNMVCSAGEASAGRFTETYWGRVDGSSGPGVIIGWTGDHASARA